MEPYVWLTPFLESILYGRIDENVWMKKKNDLKSTGQSIVDLNQDSRKVEIF